MADQAIQTTTELGPDGKPKETRSNNEQTSQAAPSNQPDWEKKYGELENIAKNAVKRADDSEAYVRQLTTSLQEAAARAGNRPQADEQPIDWSERIAQDPIGVLDQHFQARTAPIIASVAENNARQNRDFAFMRFSQEKIPGTETSLADKYGEEVDDFMKNMPATTRAEAGAYDAAMQWVRSKHVNDEVDMRYQAKVEAEKRAFVEAPTGGPGDRRPGKTLSDIEKQVAKGLGLSDDDYLKYRDMEA